MAKHAGGRPPIPPEKVKALQELYLSLIRLGMTEKQIDAVDGMCSWDTRYKWLENVEFSAYRLEAQSIGVEMQLLTHESRLEQVFSMGLDEAANKPLVDVLKEMGAHARWKASKLNSKVYGDKSKLEHTGKDGGKIESEMVIRWQDE